MLYQVGMLAIDTFPFEASEVEAETVADYAKHSLASGRKDYEPIGPGDESLKLSGQLVPFHIGGLGELEVAKQLVASLQPQFVTRGDGTVLGWYVLLRLRERHRLISPAGIGFVVTYDLEAERCDAPGDAGIGAGLIGSLLSLFGGL